MWHKVLPASKVKKQEKNQNHQSPILFPSSGRWYSRRGGTLTYTPPLSPSWGPPITLEIELPQGGTWRLNALLQQAPQGPIVHSSLSGNPCHCNLQPITLPRDGLICVDPEWTLYGCVAKFTPQGLIQWKQLFLCFFFVFFYLSVKSVISYCMPNKGMCFRIRLNDCLTLWPELPQVCQFRPVIHCLQLVPVPCCLSLDVRFISGVMG